jgi:hypothetical protein
MHPSADQWVVNHSRLVTHFPVWAASAASTPDAPCATSEPARHCPVRGSNCGRRNHSASGVAAMPCWRACMPAPNSAFGDHACADRAGTTLCSADTCVAFVAFVASSMASLSRSRPWSMKSAPKKRKPIFRRRWVKKTKKMFSIESCRRKSSEENRCSNRPSYPTIIPPLRDNDAVIAWSIPNVIGIARKRQPDKR